MLKKSKLLLILISCCMFTFNHSYSYFNSTTKVENEFNTISYNFNLNGNGGTYSSSNVAVKNNSVTLPVPTRAGYTFVGYSDSNSGNVITAKEVSNISIINNKTIYAKWNTNTYSITYNLNGGTINNSKTTYTINDSFTLVKPSRTGYEFLGWTGSNGTTPQISVTISKGNIGNKTYNANWKKIDAQITGITIVSYRSEDYGKTYETWYGNADGYYSFGTSNKNAGNWKVTVSNHSVSVVGTTNVTSKNRYYKFYIYAGEGNKTLLGTVVDKPVEYRGSGTKAKINFSW